MMISMNQSLVLECKLCRYVRLLMQEFVALIAILSTLGVVVKYPLLGRLNFKV